MEGRPLNPEITPTARIDLRLLLLEDNALDAEIVIRELRKAGFELQWTRVETEAQFLAELDTAPDLIISDYRLPQFNGLLALDRVLERDLQIPFILISGTIGEEQAALAIQRGADDYLLKDRLTRLGSAVHRALEVHEARQERKLATIALQQSEQTYRQLVQALPIAMYSIDTEGRLKQFNDAAVELSGWRPNANTEVFSGGIKLFSPDGQEIASADWPVARALRENRGILGAEYVLERADATRRNVLSFPHPIRNDDGTVSGAVSLLLDITDLKQAQQSLLATQAFAQATIDSVSAHICVLDEEGTVLAVNHAWREFCRQNNPQVNECEAAFLGINYLDVCDASYGTDAPRASAMADGIRQVVSGEATEFSLEYPCHSPTEQRWFLARVTRFRRGVRNIVVAHEDITERRRSRDALESSEAEQRRLVNELEAERARLLAAQRVAKIGSWDADRVTLAVSWSDETHRIHETDPAEYVPTFESFLTFVHPADREALASAYEQIHQPRYAHVMEHRVLMADGRIKYVEERWHNIFDAQGNAIRAVGTCQDVTDRKLQEQRVARLNRVQLFLSAINMLIVRAGDRDALYQGACRIAVDSGGFRMAMLVVADPTSGRMRVAATTGKDDELLAEIQHALETPGQYKHSLTAQAVREQRAVISNNCHLDSRLTHGVAFHGRGVQSLAVLPLVVAKKSVGAFVLYSAELDFFGTDEMDLLHKVTSDIAFAIDHIEKSARLAYLALYDPLTSLPNAQLFQDQLDHYIAAAREEDGSVCVVVLDLDGFTDINRTRGRQVGDALLRAVGTRLQSELSGVFALGRTVADSFAVACPRTGGVTLEHGRCDRVRDEVLRSLQNPFMVAGEKIRLSGKVGIAAFPSDGDDGKSVLLNAEAALKQAKASKQNYLYSSTTLNELATARRTLESELREALVEGQFRAHFQPRVDMTNGKIVGAEALIRWQHPSRGLLSPAEFIELAEETGLIVDIGAWMLQAVCAQQAAWSAAGLPVVPVAVNVSAIQLEKADLLQVVSDALKCNALAPTLLDLELTETAVMGDPEAAAAALHAVRALGVELALDDFGTGYSSLASLKRYPFSMVKIDRSFVIHITSNVEDAAIASAIIAMAHRLRMRVVAEGVETQGQFNYLRAQGCDEMQGYLVAPAKFTERPRVPRSTPSVWQAVATGVAGPRRVAALANRWR